MLCGGGRLEQALDEACDALRTEPEGGEVLAAIEQARAAAAELPATAESVERLGRGWVAEEALAIAVFCALKADSFASGVLLAVNHSGDSNSTGAMSGNLLGVMGGEGVIPVEWAQRVEAADLLRELADDLGRVLQFSSDPVLGMESTGRETPVEFAKKYPGI